ncbi:MAG: hypothetical protein DYH14_14510 [Betaproteobacteria bacterium PRO3]|nr:hypothetical protein [Betaproteobacteria bacterium PRO3]
MQFIHRNDPNAVGPGIDPAAEPAYRRADASTELPAMTEPAVVAPTKPERVDLLPLIAANVAPIAGMLFLGWSPPSLVALYAVDTALATFALVWLVMEHITEANSPDRGVVRVAKLGFAALFLGTLLTAILVGPMVLMLGEGAWALSKPWLDRGFQGALAAQAAGSAWSLVSMHRMLGERSDDDAVLKREFQFLVARWVVVLGVVFLGVASFLGERFGGALIVIVYCGATVWFRMFPERANRMFFPDKAKPPGSTAR